MSAFEDAVIQRIKQLEREVERLQRWERAADLGLGKLTDPNADRVLFWDDSAGALKWLTVEGIVDTDFGKWTSWTPEVSYTSTPAPTSCTINFARYTTIGRTCIFALKATIVRGSCVAWGTRFSYPPSRTAARTNQAFNAIESLLGDLTPCTCFTDASEIFVVHGTMTQDGELMVSGSYEY